MSVWDTSATPSEIKREWYVCIFIHRDHTCEVDMSECISNHEKTFNLSPNFGKLATLNLNKLRCEEFD
jgi:hypothetical protein